MPHPNMSHLVIIIPFYQRHRITAAIFRHYKQMQAAFRQARLSILAVGSEGRVSRDLALSEGVDYVEANNFPLDEKYEFGFIQARAYHADAICLVGSNDLISAAYFEKALRAICEGSADSTGLLDCYLVDETSRRILYWPGYPEDQPVSYQFGSKIGKKIRHGESIGAGRMFSRAILECMNWKPFRTDLRPLEDVLQDDQRNLELLHEHRAKILNWRIDEVPCVYWNIKTDTDLNPLLSFEIAYGPHLIDVTLEQARFWDDFSLVSRTIEECQPEMSAAKRRHSARSPFSNP